MTAFDDDTASVSITSSAGFYVRSFAHELGRMLGCGACLEALRRTRSGEFTLAAAAPFELIAGGEGLDAGVRMSRIAEAMVPPGALLQGLPAVRVTAEGLDWVAHGRDLGPPQWLQAAVVRDASWLDEGDRSRGCGCSTRRDISWRSRHGVRRARFCIRPSS